jgi:DNA-binding XRE family transcriptional regulator
MTTFKDVLQRMRKQYIGKQFTLAVSLGCTEAAISFWEHGRRLPQRTLLTRIVTCFRASGARPDEVAELQQAYEGRIQHRKRKEEA